MRPLTSRPMGDLICAAAASILITAAAAQFYPSDPLPGHTGGFGEPTCRTCHFDNDLNDPAGRFEIAGLPDEVPAGETYHLVIRIDHPQLERAGFQLSARAVTGEQAGSFEPDGRRAAVTRAGDEPVQYVHHTAKGAGRTSGLVEWRIRWTAPEAPGPVLIHAAGNAANGDESEFGDFIYTLERKLEVR